LSEYGLCVKLDESEFFKTSVEYLGYIIDKGGKRSSKLSVEAIKQLKRPENVSEIQAFLWHADRKVLKNTTDKFASSYDKSYSIEKFCNRV